MRMQLTVRNGLNPSMIIRILKIYLQWNILGTLYLHRPYFSGLCNRPSGGGIILTKFYVYQRSERTMQLETRGVFFG